MSTRVRLIRVLMTTKINIQLLLLLVNLTLGIYFHVISLCTTITLSQNNGPCLTYLRILLQLLGTEFAEIHRVIFPSYSH